MPMTQVERQRRWRDRLYAKARKADALEALARDILVLTTPDPGMRVDQYISQIESVQRHIRQVLEAGQ